MSILMWLWFWATALFLESNIIYELNYRPLPSSSLETFQKVFLIQFQNKAVMHEAWYPFKWEHKTTGWGGNNLRLAFDKRRLRNLHIMHLLTFWNMKLRKGKERERREEIFSSLMHQKCENSTTILESMPHLHHCKCLIH